MSAGKTPVVLQAERSECALACMAMVLGYHGHRIDLNTLRGRHPVSRHGITLKGLVMLAGRLALAARPLRLEPVDLDKLVLPAVLHWDMDHFVVLVRVTRRHLVIHNPAVGRQEVPRKEAGRHFTGIALELLPAASFSPRDDRRRLRLDQLWPGGAGLAAGLAQLLVLSLLLQGFALALPFYTQLVLDDVLVSHDIELLRVLAAGFLLLVLFRQLTELLRAHVVLYLSNRVSFQFASSLCRHLLHLPLDYFSRRHIGDIVSRFGSLHQVRDFLCSGLVEIVIDGVMVAGALALMFWYDSLLTAIALAAVCVYGVIRLASYSRFHVRNEEWINDRAAENSLFMENVHAIQGIKLAGREPQRLAAWQNRYATSINSGIRVQKLGINVQFAQGLLTGAENVLLLFVGSHAVIAGGLSVGMLMAFLSFKDHFYRSVFALLDKLFEFRLLDLHLGRLADIAFTTAEPEPLPCLPAGKQSYGPRLVLENIGFRYDDDAPWLFRHLSLALGEREIIAIVGPTGCGKSTLLKIVAGLALPGEGRMLLDGSPVGRTGLAGYRQCVAGVMQNDSLLSGSILENITFFDAVPDPARVREVARLAGIEAEIDGMPMQFNTMAGGMGSALSGGQVQRLLLARALYQQPGLLVLDEATSHLDLAAENRVNGSLRQLGIPCLVAAHRPETVLRADRIFRLERNGLVQVSHGEFRGLMSNQPENDGIRI